MRQEMSRSQHRFRADLSPRPPLLKSGRTSVLPSRAVGRRDRDIVEHAVHAVADQAPFRELLGRSSSTSCACRTSNEQSGSASSGETSKTRTSAELLIDREDRTLRAVLVGMRGCGLSAHTNEVEAGWFLREALTDQGRIG
jgi:hypothetical protein